MRAAAGDCGQGATLSLVVAFSFNDLGRMGYNIVHSVETSPRPAIGRNAYIAAIYVNAGHKTYTPTSA